MTALRPPVTAPCDLALPGRLLRSALSYIDVVNPFAAVSQPAELEFDALDRDGQVAAFVAWRERVSDHLNGRRLEDWRQRYFVTEQANPVSRAAPVVIGAIEAPAPVIDTAAAMAAIGAAVNAEVETVREKPQRSLRVVSKGKP